MFYIYPTANFTVVWTSGNIPFTLRSDFIGEIFFMPWNDYLSIPSIINSNIYSLFLQNFVIRKFFQNFAVSKFCWSNMKSNRLGACLLNLTLVFSKMWRPLELISWHLLRGCPQRDGCRNWNCRYNWWSHSGNMVIS